MGLSARLSTLLLGSDLKLRRMLSYWSATAMLYIAFVVLLYEGVAAGLIGRAGWEALAWYAAVGVLISYCMVRASSRLRLAPTLLAVLQGLFGITCNMWAYSITGPLRGSTLMGLMVVVVFCTFALRPRQTLLLAATGLVGMGGTMWWHHAQDPAAYPATSEVVTFTIMAACSVSVTLLTGEMTKLRARLKAQREELAGALETIRVLATIDELTALANRRHMNEMLAREERRQAQEGDSSARPTCIALLDIDFFKQINDRHGHACGDEALRRFAGAARAELRAADVLARWGGEEFLLMLPDTGEPEAAAVLERIRARVAGLTLEGVVLERRISFSAGLCARRGAEPLADTVNRADKALYQAKSAGRDRVATA